MTCTDNLKQLLLARHSPAYVLGDHVGLSSDIQGGVSR
jgi:hypothetical protein